MLTEVDAYYKRLRREQSKKTATTFSLTFDPTGSYLAVGTTTGDLTIHALQTAACSSIAEASAAKCTVTTITLPAAQGPINALLSTSTTLFLATDLGVSAIDWHLLRPDQDPHAMDDILEDTSPQPVYLDMQVNALARLADSDSLIAATADASLIRIDPGVDSALPKVTKLPGSLGSSAYPHCLASSPTDRHCVFMGCDDGIVRQYDLRRSKGGIIREITEINLKSSNKFASTPLSTMPYVSSIAVNLDGTYAIIAKSDGTVSSLHIASGTIVSSTQLPFLPQAIAFSKAAFYIGGSDRHGDPASTFPYALVSFDVLMTCTAVSPVSSTAIYTVATHPKTGMLAAAGFTSATDPTKWKQLVDVYVEPPVRSFSILL